MIRSNEENISNVTYNYIQAYDAKKRFFESTKEYKSEPKRSLCLHDLHNDS